MKNENSDGLDLVTPFVVVLEQIITQVFKLTGLLIKCAYQKLTGASMPLKKIELKQLNTKKYTNNIESLGVLTSTKKDIKLSDIDFRRHSFIVGASGFGKTNLISILQEDNLRSGKPVIFFDPKGDHEALTTFKNLCEAHSRPCYIFSEHYHDSISLNPIYEGTVNQVVDRIMRSFEWSEPYYRDASRRSLTKALNIMKERGDEFTLKRVFDELVQMESKDNIGLIAKLEAILVSDFGRILNAEDGMCLSKVREEGACLYIGLSTQGYGETAMSVGKLFLGELLYNSYTSLISASDTDRLDNPISVYFDEFGALVTPEFIELQNKCRGAGIELTMAVQTASDIDRINPDLTKQIIENSGNLFVMKQRLDTGASLFSDSIGTITSTKKTAQTEDGVEQSKGSIREVNELICHPDIIKNLKIGQCVLLRQSPTRVDLINVRNRGTTKLVKQKQTRELAPAL